LILALDLPPNAVLTRYGIASHSGAGLEHGLGLQPSGIHGIDRNFGDR